MILTAKITGYDGRTLEVIPDTPIDRELLKKQIHTVELRLDDGRHISAEQRKKIFAMIRDISEWSGHDPEPLRQLMTWDFVMERGMEWFSLSTVDMTTAKEFINYLIDFCFRMDIPTKDTLLHETDDISRYLYLCLEHRKCAVCNDPAEVHHVDRVGMGRDREQIVHEGLNAIALCRRHHDMAHTNESRLFERNHIYGIKLDKHLCEVLNLKKQGDC